MELAKIRNLSDEELQHQEKTSAEQLFRLRFQVSLGQNDGVKKLRQLRKEIAQIKTVARERELGIRGEAKTRSSARPSQRRRRKAVRTEREEARRSRRRPSPAQRRRAKKPAKAKKAAAAAKRRQRKKKGAGK